MATVKRNGVIAVMRYNTPHRVNISIMTTDDGNEIVLMHSEVEFLHNVLSEWLKEAQE